MERIKIEARPGWQSMCEDVGFNWHTLDPNLISDPVYWDETTAYKFNIDEIEKIEEASGQLYRMCLSAVEYVLEKDLLTKLEIPVEFHKLVKKSWERQDLDLYGRFDLAFDPNGVPKMLEFNADTPTSLLEASVVQWIWMEDHAKRTGQSLDQYNSIHEKLIECFGAIGEALIGPDETFYFSSVLENTEDFGTVHYLRDCAAQAKLKTDFIPIEHIGWNGLNFTDMSEQPINTLFKLYPWEFLVREEFGAHMTRECWDVVEPAWKLILSNKGILPILWELYEGHENLLPAYWNSAPLKGNFVEKPLLSREGANVNIYKNGVLSTKGLDLGYDKVSSLIYQDYLPLQKFDGMIPILGAWMVGGRPAGMGIREDASEVTGNLSHFIPHFFDAE